jgi:hypothetical protein
MLTITTNLNPVLRFAESVRQSLAAPARDTAGLGEGLQTAVHVYAQAMRRRFAAASAGDGTWAPLAASTLKAKLRRGLGSRILFVTGQLQNSLESGATGNVFDVGDMSIIYGTANRVARFHQDGNSRLPRRTILVPPTDEVLQKCIAPIRAAWQKVLNAHTTASRMAT